MQVHRTICWIRYVLVLSLVSILPNAPVIAESFIEEVVVTARKREESALDTPVSVTVLSGEDIDVYNTRGLVQLTARVPGLAIENGGGGFAGGDMTIRGIGRTALDYGLDSSVTLWIDGMAFSRGHMTSTGLFDATSVEVQKGPQSLYYGKNTIAGVVAIHSVSPVVGEETEGFLRASYEFETEDPVFEGGVSFPLGDTLAVRLAARYQDMQGGWLENSARPLDASVLYPGTNFQTRGAAWEDFPKQEETIARATIVWEPSDNFDANLKLFRADTKRADTVATILWSCADGPGANPFFAVSFVQFADPTQTCPDGSPRLLANAALPPIEVSRANPFTEDDGGFFYELEQDLYTLQMNWDLGNYTITSVTGYWDYESGEQTDYAWTSWATSGLANQGESGESFTQELRVSSNFDGDINFTVGAFFEDSERAFSAPIQVVTPVVYHIFGAFLPPPLAGDIVPFDGGGLYDGAYLNAHQIWDNDIESLSVFAGIDWQLTEDLELSGGLRYTDEERSASGGNVFENSGFFGFSPSGVTYNPSTDSDNVSPEATLSYHLNDDVMGFVSYKTGFQAGGISNPGTVPNLSALPVEVQNDVLAFDETEVEGIEVGLKGRFMDGRMRAELGAFFYELEDLQVGIFNAATVSVTLQNAAVAHNWGLEANILYYVNERLQLRFAGQYNKLEYDEWEDASCHSIDNAIPAALLPTTGPGCHVTTDPLSGASVKIQDLSGVRYGGPSLQLNAGLTYERPLTEGWGLGFSWDTIHHSEGERALNQPGTEIPSRTVTHLALSVYQEEGPWQANLMCSNCFNEIYVSRIGNKPLGKIIPGVAGDLVADLATPRLLTLSITYSL